MDLNVCQRSELNDWELVGLISLWQRVWPDSEFEGDSLDEQAGRFREERAFETDFKELFHVLYEGETILGVSRSFVREIVFLESKKRMNVLALAGVCSGPDLRGKGIGKRVVLSAFARICDALPLFLYQTGVPRFYEKLGASVVENEFVNSHSESAPTARPWWDSHVMVRGDQSKWRKGRVDLLGAGY